MTGEERWPPVSIVMLEPGRENWLDGRHLKWLSEAIVALDGSRYSHALIRRHGSVIDARLRQCAVQETSFDSIVCLPRQMAFLVPKEEGVLERVWDAIASEFQITDDRPLGSEPNRFTVFGLLRLGIILTMEGTGWRQKLGQWLVSRHRDEPGLFCSELIAKGFIEADAELLVYPRGRIPPGGSEAEKALIAMLVARKDINLGPAIDEVGNEAVEQIFTELFAGLRTAISAEEPVPVGRAGPGKCGFPPSLVTPRDLLDSPSLEFVMDRNGSTCKPVLPADERRQRHRAWVTVTLGIPVLALFVARTFLRGLRR